MAVARDRLKTLALLVAAPVALPLVFVLCYLLIAFGLVLFPANTAPRTDTAAIDIQVVSNGVHTDLVLPVRTAAVDWATVFPLTDFVAAPTPAYIAIGWGDREFYLNTPEWKDLTARGAFKALTGQDATLLHVEYQSDRRAEGAVLRVSQAQYAALVGHVLTTAVLNQGRAIAIPGRHYGQHDAFYEANGAYSLVHTCNSWVGQGLRQAGVKVSRWTPLDTTVLWHLRG